MRQDIKVIGGGALLLILVAFAVPTICQENGAAAGGVAQMCAVNETWNGCGNRCESKCGVPPRPCPRICDPGACACKPGFFSRNDQTGECVGKGDCPPDSSQSSFGEQPRRRKKKREAECAGDNETYRQCSSMCEPKCGDPPGGVACIEMCGPPKCQCSRGFVRDQNGNCVKQSACRPSSRKREVPTNPCALTDCFHGMDCVVGVDGQAKCVKQSQNYVCDGKNCPDGQKCVARQVQCIRAPCPPIPECVPGEE